MKILAYILTPITSLIASLVGGFIVHVVVSVILSRLPLALRNRVAGFAGGFAMACVAVLAGWCIFAWLCGPGHFSGGALVASTILIANSVFGDFKKARDICSFRDEFVAGGFKLKPDFDPESDATEFLEKIDMPETCPASAAYGKMLGLLTALLWFIST